MAITTSETGKPGLFLYVLVAESPLGSETWVWGRVPRIATHPTPSRSCCGDLMFWARTSSLALLSPPHPSCYWKCFSHWEWRGQPSSSWAQAVSKGMSGTWQQSLMLLRKTLLAGGAGSGEAGGDGDLGRASLCSPTCAEMYSIAQRALNLWQSFCLSPA